ncbi:hypothetical protein [Amycolatopsis sp. cg9]|uniref:hypothetical protein n=1 Tax=Amycolatopsis sp. cg9 TaxID=3238801 RepID=UPI003523CDC8
MSTPTDTKPEETPEPIEQAGPVVPHPEPDEHGWVHVGHKPETPVVSPNCGDPCYQRVN